ncbi:MAG: hypothetical protein ABI586_00635 [Candidatus Nanopelagicales bacterium]
MTAPSPTRGLRGWWIAILAVILAFLLVAAGVIWWFGGVGSMIGREQCVATHGEDSVSLDLEQAQLAATIAASASRRQLPARAVTVGLATAIQESKLHNLKEGDHDSAGMFQQRPSQGWGSFAQVTDPTYATDQFFDALTGVDGWETLAITKAAQAVQQSAYPAAYQQHVVDARILTATFTGRAGAALTCVIRAEDQPTQAETETGLTPRAQRLREAMETAVGPLSLGGFAPGGVTRANPSAHNEGRAIDVFFRPYKNADQRQHGWAMANWLLAHAYRLNIAIVIYRDLIWSAARSPEGWREYTSPYGDPSDPVLRHLDHIHVEVA